MRTFLVKTAYGLLALWVMCGGAMPQQGVLRQRG
jgi:hypothetical protein